MLGCGELNVAILEDKHMKGLQEALLGERNAGNELFFPGELHNFVLSLNIFLQFSYCVL